MFWPLQSRHGAAHGGFLRVPAGRAAETPAGSSARELPAIRMPDHAVLDTVFTPEAKQDAGATVFSNDDGAPNEHAGFQFQHIGDDRYNRYRLAVGLRGQWAFSKELLLPHNLPVALSVEFKENAITILYDGVKCVEMQLAGRMTDSAAPITIGSWIDRQRLFAGTVRVFEIRDLGPRDGMK